MNLVAKLIEHKRLRPKGNAVSYYNKGRLFHLTWKQVYDRVEQLHAALLHLGIQPGDRVAIYSNTSKEWGFLDLAIMACRAVTVPVYHSSHPEEVKIILEDSKPRFIFVENEALYKSMKKTFADQLPAPAIAVNDFEPSGPELLSMKTMIDCPAAKTSLEDVSNSIHSDELATIIYTSGTSGRPKGVMLTHKQIESSVSEVFPLLGVTDKDRTLTFLPFSHVLGRIELWGHYFCGYTIGYAQSIEKIKRNIPQIKPTVIVGVPRIFEKIYYGIQAQVEISKLKQKIFKQALKIGRNNQKLKQKEKSPSFVQALKSQWAHQMVFSNIHEKMGGHLRFAISGGAPLDERIADFFGACGIPVLEGYGLTETTGPIFVNTQYENQHGSVGKAVGDVQLRLAEDNEILVKSDKVMQGYYNLEEETEKAFTDDGFLHTGDIGEIDEQGFLKITDRKKDLIKTAGGKFVAPQKLQSLFSTDPLISHVHVHGDKKKYIVALFTLEKDQLFKIKEDQGLSGDSYKDLANSEKVLKEVRSRVAQVNSGLASFETIKRFKVLDHEFSIEEGQLTPSLKMKRKKINEMYADQIENLYN